PSRPRAPSPPRAPSRPPAPPRLSQPLSPRAARGPRPKLRPRTRPRKGPASHDARGKSPTLAHADIDAGRARIRDHSPAGGSRSAAPRLSGAGGLLLVDRIAPRGG